MLEKRLGNSREGIQSIIDVSTFAKSAFESFNTGDISAKYK